MTEQRPTTTKPLVSRVYVRLTDAESKASVTRTIYHVSVDDVLAQLTAIYGGEGADDTSIEPSEDVIFEPDRNEQGGS